ncbi:MAG: hypothetical protein RJB38_1064 [Pseudomonadota bacterium]|jgi:prophage maintenance system killer protein
MSEFQFNRETLRLQLERARFERALEVCESLVEHRALLTHAELARLNTILTGKQPTDDPWRQSPMTMTLRSGKQVQFAVMADPKVNLRDQLHQATEMAENGAVIDAAVKIYVNMVLSHYFQDANRRSAVLSAHYFLKRYGTPISGVAIHEMGLGDVRDPAQVEILRDTLKSMARLK